jgi:hypothetical protein
MMMSSKEIAIIQAQTNVRVSVTEAQQWFLSLKEHPQRYRFATHEGFQFVEGDFGEVGAWFLTRETFLGLKQRLHFELTAVETADAFASRAAFRFRLLKPLGGRIWGEFSIRKAAPGAITLHLDIGASDRLGSVFLRFSPLAAVVRRQVQREVAHIKASMERVFVQT